MFLPDKNGHRRFAAAVTPLAAKDRIGSIIQRFQMLQNGFFFLIAILFSVIEGDGHDTTDFQKTQSGIDGSDRRVCRCDDVGISAGKAAEVKDDAVDSSGGGILLHVGMTVQDHFCLQAFLSQKGAGLINGILLNVKSHCRLLTIA